MRTAKNVIYSEMASIFFIKNGQLFRKAYSDGSRSYKEKQVLCTNADKDGYFRVRVNGVNIFYHRIIWVLYNKSDINSGLIIDHKDGDPSNNTPENLRLVLDVENCKNKAVHRSGKKPGCYFDKRVGKWRADIQLDRYRKFLGYYNTEFEAYSIYLKAERELRYV